MVGSAIGESSSRSVTRCGWARARRGNEKAHAWAEAAGTNASEGSFADAAGFGELVVNCTAGQHSLDALEQAGRGSLDGKALVDVANALDFSGGRPPTLGVCNTDSLGEQIQRAFPDAKVVKALNTMNCEVMVDLARVPGEHVVFVCGEDAEAKGRVAEVLESFGWPAERIVDLGGIRAARGTEMYLPLWLRSRRSAGHARLQHRRRASVEREPVARADRLW